MAYEIVQTADILEKNELTFQDFWRRTYWSKLGTYDMDFRS